MIRFYLFTITLVIVTCILAQAQGPSNILEFKQGFRDAKMGMSFSAFKGMKLANHDELTMRMNGEFYPTEYVKVYERLSDSKRLGTAPLMHIYYKFYKGKLCAINIIANARYEEGIINTLHNAYGTSSYTPPFNNGDGKYIYSWYANTIDLCAINFTLSGTIGKFLIISFNSIPISREIEEEQARRKGEAKFNRTDGL